LQCPPLVKANILMCDGHPEFGGEKTLAYSYASGWRKKIAEDLEAEISGISGPSEVVEIRRFLAEKGLRELEALVQEEVARAGTVDPIQVIARTFNRYARSRPALATAAFVALTAAEETSGTRSLTTMVHGLLVRQRLASEVVEHSMRILIALARGFLAVEIGGGYGSAFACGRSFEIAVESISKGMLQRAG
jgi:hypothetical protein